MRHVAPESTIQFPEVVEPLDLVHSDVCGKMNARSLGGAEYFITFIDDQTRGCMSSSAKMKSSSASSSGKLSWRSQVGGS